MLFSIALLGSALLAFVSAVPEQIHISLTGSFLSQKLLPSSCAERISWFAWGLLAFGCPKGFRSLHLYHLYRLGLDPCPFFEDLNSRHLSRIFPLFTGRPHEMGVDFVTSAGSSGLTCRYGLNASSLPLSSTVTSAPFSGNGWKATMNYCFLTGLKVDTTYFYQVGNEAEGFSAIISFVNEQASREPIACVYADFGIANDVSLATIIKDADAGGFDFVLHGGDHAYDLDSSNSAVGNDFMLAIQPYASRIPYMAAVGVRACLLTRKQLVGV